MALHHKMSQTINNNNKSTKWLKKIFCCMNERKAGKQEIQEKMNIN